MSNFENQRYYMLNPHKNLIKLLIKTFTLTNNTAKSTTITRTFSTTTLNHKVNIIRLSVKSEAIVKSLEQLLTYKKVA